MKNILVIAGVFLIFFAAIHSWRPFLAYRLAKMSMIPVGFRPLVWMRLQGVDPVHVVEAYVMAAIMGGGKAGGFNITMDKLAQHRRAGGDAVKVMQAVIASSQAEIGLEFEELCRMDLSGEDPLEHIARAVKGTEGKL
ncbi:flotillin-like FloA family protein [Candidatus Hydrogenedentota bacterium]